MSEVLFYTESLGRMYTFFVLYSQTLWTNYRSVNVCWHAGYVLYCASNRHKIVIKGLINISGINLKTFTKNNMLLFLCKI